MLPRFFYPTPIWNFSPSSRRAWRSTRNANARGALSIALGLCGYSPAQDKLSEQLNKNSHRAELAGYLSTTLALLKHKASVPLVRHIAMKSQHRPNLLVKTCTALALLKDKSIAPKLLNDALDHRRFRHCRMH